MNMDSNWGFSIVFIRIRGSQGNSRGTRPANGRWLGDVQNPVIKPEKHRLSLSLSLYIYIYLLDIYIYIYIYIYISIYIYIYISISIYIYISIYLYLYIYIYFLQKI